MPPPVCGVNTKEVTAATAGCDRQRVNGRRAAPGHQQRDRNCAQRHQNAHADLVTQLPGRQQNGAEKEPDGEADREDEGGTGELSPSRPSWRMQSNSLRAATPISRPSNRPISAPIGIPHVPSSNAERHAGVDKPEQQHRHVSRIAPPKKYTMATSLTHGERTASRGRIAIAAELAAAARTARRSGVRS